MKNDQEYIERRIISGLIVSKDYLDRVQKFWSPAFLDSPELKTVAKWCMDYFQRYKKPPNADIQDLYMEALKAGSISKVEAQYIEELLSGLSDEFDRGSQFNSDYLYDQTIKYFKRQELEQHNREIEFLIESGQVEKAEELASSYKPSILNSVEGLELSSEEALDAIDRAFTSAYTPVVSYPGDLGNMWNEHLVRGGFFTLLAPEKRGKCLAGNQRILLSDGSYMSLVDVIKNKRTSVVSFDEKTQQFVIGKISNYWENGVKPVYKVTTRSGRTVVVTNNHPFLTPGGWKELQEMTVGEFIAVPKECAIFGKEDLPDHIVKSLAYFIADGGLTGNIPQFTKSDPEVQDDFSDCITKMGCQTKWNGIGAFVVNSKEKRRKHNKNYVKEILKEYGIWGKLSRDKAIPDAIFQLSKQKLSLFLRVLFTCDGWINKASKGRDYQIGYGTASKTLAEQLHVLLTRFGIVSKLYFTENEKSGAWTVSIGDAENIKRFCKEIGFLYEKGEKARRVISKLVDSRYRSFLDKFPYQIAQKFHDEILMELDGCSEIKNIGNRWQRVPNFRRIFKKAPAIREQIAKKASIMRASFQEVKDTQTGRKYLNSCILWDEIVSIEYQGKQLTFDLTVDKYHNFVAENIVVHNSFMLMEIALRAIRQKANVAFFEAGDMTEAQVLRRICIYISQKSDKEKYCQERFRPVGDCLFNQLDTCNRDDRNCDHGIFDVSPETYYRDIAQYQSIDTLKQKYAKFPDYKPCDSYSCSGRQGVVWVQKVKKCHPLTADQAKKRLREFFNKYKRRFRLITYPAGLLSVSEIRRCLDSWERYDGFVPDVVVVDYADLLSADDGKVAEFRHRQDHIWKALRALSQERHVLMLTATQADTDSYKRDRLSISNFSEDKRKLAHVTAQFGLNQDPQGREKKLGIVRINEIVVREGEFSNDNEVCVLQDLATGRAFLESFSLAKTRGERED